MDKPVTVTRAKLLVLYISMILVVIAAVVFSIYTMDANMHAQLDLQQQAAQASTVSTCKLLDAFKAGYEQEPPQTTVGMRQYMAILDLYNQFQCGKLLQR